MKSSFHSTHTPRYPWEYSSSIVESFVEKHTRATIFWGKERGMSPRETHSFLIKLFMVNNNRWNVTRDLIKWIGKPGRIEQLLSMTRSQALNYLTCVESQVEDARIYDKKDFSAIDNS